MLEVKSFIVVDSQIKDIWIKQLDPIHYKVSGSGANFKMSVVKLSEKGTFSFAAIVENINTKKAAGACLDLDFIFGNKNPTFADITIQRQMGVTELEAKILTATFKEIYLNLQVTGKVGQAN